MQIYFISDKKLDMFSSAVPVSECSTHPSSLYGGERYTETRVTQGKKTTLLGSPRLHQNWLLRLLCPKSLDTRVKKPLV